MQSKKTEIPNFPRKFVYFEKQSNDRLCGLHCLNNLLQGPYFDIVVLSEIGLELDKIERELTGGNYTRTNVDDDGNYGIQVLTKALKLYGADLTPLKKRQAISYIESNGRIEALIFNSSTHWFAIRKINDIWFNLNSTNSLPGPEIISDFYLSAFIQGAEDIGYTNFLVTNLPKLPELNGNMYSNLQTYQSLVKFEDIIKAKELKNAAIKEREMEQKKKEEEEAKKFKAFSGKGYTLDEHVLDAELGYEDEDDEMKQAMKLSLEEFARSTLKQLPPEPKEGGFNIIVSYNGKSYTRRFNDNDKIKHIIMFAKSQIPTFSHILLFEAFPKKNYDDEDKTLVEAGLGRHQLLMCKLIN